MSRRGHSHLRAALRLVVALWAVVTAALFFAVESYASNPIVIENQQPGSSGWRIGQSGFSIADDTTQQIKGYASATSVNKGNSITFYVTVNPSQSYSIDIYRLGWYQGLGGRLMQHAGGLAGATQPSCPTDSTTGLIECNWAAAYVLSVPTTWTSGVYVAVLTNAQNYQNYITFVVRDDSRSAALLYQQSVTTYQAYNNYPANGSTGKSLYAFNSYGANTISGGPQAVKVSFDRPYTGSGAGELFNYEVYFIHWLERTGYDVSYSTDVDTNTNGGMLLNYKGFLSVGHDEYWSKPMYDAVAAARDAGVNLGFFGADAIYWQIRFEPSPTTNIPNRVIVCYRSASLDPVQGPTTTVQWRDPYLNRPEQQLVGVQYIAQIQNSPVSYAVSNSSNWVYAGTGFIDGTQVAGIVGYEVDRLSSAYPGPAAIPGTYTLLSQSPVLTTSGTADYSNSSVYQALSGARVFGAGTIEWSWGLDRQGSMDSRIQQTTQNVLNNFVFAPAAPRNVTATAGDQTVSLAWTANSESDLIGYNVYRSTSLPVSTSSVPINGMIPLTATSYLDGGLVDGTTYYYAVEAVNSAGYKTAANPVSATPQATTVSPPAAPTGVTATAGDQTITLTWNPNTESNLAGYNVYRSTSLPVNTSGAPLNGSTLLSTTAYADIGLTNGTTYYYVVEAVNTAGLKADSSPVNATPVSSAPAAPSNLAAQRAGGTKNPFVNLSWTDNSTNETGFVIQRSSDGVNFTLLATVGANVVGYKDTTVVSKATYYYRTKAVNGGGSSAWSNTASVTLR